MTGCLRERRDDDLHEPERAEAATRFMRDAALAIPELRGVELRFIPHADNLLGRACDDRIEVALTYDFMVTLIHEMGHVLAGPAAGHGRAWGEACLWVCDVMLGGRTACRADSADSSYSGMIDAAIGWSLEARRRRLEMVDERARPRSLLRDTP